LERFIAVAPEQWYIFKPIWPTTPDEERNLATAVAALAGSSGAGGTSGIEDDAELKANDRPRA
jgi:hypothetical protein